MRQDAPHCGDRVGANRLHGPEDRRAIGQRALCLDILHPRHAPLVEKLLAKTRVAYDKCHGHPEVAGECGVDGGLVHDGPVDAKRVDHLAREGMVHVGALMARACMVAHEDASVESGVEPGHHERAARRPSHEGNARVHGAHLGIHEVGSLAVRIGDHDVRDLVVALAALDALDKPAELHVERLAEGGAVLGLLDRLADTRHTLHVERYVELHRDKTSSRCNLKSMRATTGPVRPSRSHS